MQHYYNAWKPTQEYYAFAAAAGCNTSDAHSYNGSIFECLVSQDTQTLATAATNISQIGVFATWAFVPVTDGSLIQQRPSEALAAGHINGISHLTGNNALEGAAFVPPGIATINDLVDYVKTLLPNFTNNDIVELLAAYPIGNASTNTSAPLWATNGSSGGPTNLNQSSAATGQQERAIAIYGETTIICPSYWLAEAYSNNSRGGDAWKYQFSIPNAEHGTDTYLTLLDFYSPDITYAFRRMYGNFILYGNPSISSAAADGISSGNSIYNSISAWPVYDIDTTIMADWNTTCPEIFEYGGLPFCGVNGTVKNEISLVNAYTWEDGRGERCEFWRTIGAEVPE